VSKPKRGKTVLELRYPDAPEELIRTAEVWVAGNSDLILHAIWAGYDRMRQDSDLAQAVAGTTDDIERGITRMLYFAIDDGLTHEEPFRLLHGAPEDETRKRRPARPPEYDITFAMRANPRIMWSLEAKVLKSPGSLAEYVHAVQNRFLAGTYAPFVAEGAMAAYLLSGAHDQTFVGIAAKLGVKLSTAPQWKKRPHRVSVHEREMPKEKPYPVRFRCHHLVMEFVLQ
jgi:hypothetical protein